MADDDYDDEYDDISDGEKLAIVKYFVTHTPPGHTKTIIEAAKKLNCEDILTNDIVDAILRDYNIKNVISTDGPASSKEKLVICPETEVDPHNYLHPSSGQVVAFDHITGKAGAARDATAEENPSKLKAKRTALQAALTEYVEKNYDSKGAGCVVTETSTGQSAIISAQVIKYSAYWSGRWKSEWTIQFNGKKAKVEGTISVMAHYYEKGNVQMHNVKDVAAVDIGDASFAKKFVAHVKKTEDALQDEYQRMYTSMKDTTFKELRRMLPITGVKFPWHNPNHHSMANKAASGGSS
jgi:capping protein alpha